MVIRTKESLLYLEARWAGHKSREQWPNELSSAWREHIQNDRSFVYLTPTAAVQSTSSFRVETDKIVGTNERSFPDAFNIIGSHGPSSSFL
jgi:hypothetical protein